jgi:hypothetical protein
MEPILKILCLCFYFEPDLSAGSFKNSALVKALSKCAPDGSEITVVTTMPNRYASFEVQAPALEVRGNVRICRLQLPSHQSGMIDQSRAFISYACGVLHHTKNHKYDLVYASSSRLMMSVLGSWISSRQRIPLFLDIRDLFVDTIREVLPGRVTFFALPVFAKLEKWAVSRACQVNVVSGGFIPYFKNLLPDKSISEFTNGIDQEFLDIAPKVERLVERVVPEVLYAGNMGEGQGLHHIIPELAKHFEGRLTFRLVGSGGRLAQLQQALLDIGVNNVILQAPVTRDALVKLYEQADILFLHLNDYEAFKKVLPSKIFEYGALGKPVWAGVGGYAAQFIEMHLANAVVFPPCNVRAAIESFSSLEMKVQPRILFIEQFRRSAIVEQMANKIIEIAAHSLKEVAATANSGS